MPLITYKALSGITATIIPNQQFLVISAYGPAPTSLTLPSGNYTLLFGNVDGVLSYDPLAPANASFGTYYYELDGTGTGPGGNGDPSVMAVGFDAVADEVVPVLFEAGKGDGEFTERLPPIASGTFTDTLDFAFTLTPPEGDGISQTGAYEPAAFSYWFNLYTGKEQFVIRLPKGGEIGEALAVPPGTSATYLAVYVAPPKPTSTGPVVGPIHVPSDCPALLANAAAAQQVYGAAQSSGTTGAGALTLLKNFSEAAELGAAPCKASELERT